MAKVIIFGCAKFAELAHYYLTTDSEHEVVAFCVNKNYLPKEKLFNSLPIVAFENVEELYPTKEYSFFAPVTAAKMNTIKEDIYYSIKKKGYDLISYISSNANIANNVTVGDNCFIQEANTIGPFSKIGNNVMLWASNYVAHHGVIKDHVTFASEVAVAGDCVIGENSYLGTNSTIRDGITLAKGTLVGIATVIVKNTDEWSVYLGNPARKIGNGISKSILKL